jgi:hypothetical protein
VYYNKVRRLQILTAALQFRHAHHLLPTMQDIAAMTGIPYTSVHFYIKKLEREGKIVRAYGKQGIAVVGDPYPAPLPYPDWLPEEARDA